MLIKTSPNGPRIPQKYIFKISNTVEKFGVFYNFNTFKSCLSSKKLNKFFKIAALKIIKNIYFLTLIDDPKPENERKFQKFVLN